MTAETARDLLAQPADRWLYAITDAKVHAYKFPAYDRAPRILRGDRSPR